MTTKLFIVGRPGSGKSTAAQYISGIARDRHWDVKRTHIDDYPILQNMTKSQPEKFRLKENGGFDVLDLSVLDVALRHVEQMVKAIEDVEQMVKAIEDVEQMVKAIEDVEQMVRALEDDGRERLVTIEFARDDYTAAFKLFNPTFIQNSYLLFLHASIETCLRRIHSRVASPTSADDHPSFSDEIYKLHYANDNLAYIRSLQREEQSGFKYIKIVENEDSLKDLRPSLEELIDAMLQPQLLPLPSL